jgi:hypothetical protein
VYTVWGACEDVSVLEKFRSGDYSLENFHIIDESSTAVIDIGGVKLRLFGLGGAYAQHKLFDIGDGRRHHSCSEKSHNANPLYLCLWQGPLRLLI